MSNDSDLPKGWQQAALAGIKEREEREQRQQRPDPNRLRAIDTARAITGQEFFDDLAVAVYESACAGLRSDLAKVEAENKLLLAATRGITDSALTILNVLGDVVKIVSARAPMRLFKQPGYRRGWLDAMASVSAALEK